MNKDQFDRAQKTMSILLGLFIIIGVAVPIGLMSTKIPILDNLGLITLVVSLFVFLVPILAMGIDCDRYLQEEWKKGNHDGWYE